MLANTPALVATYGGLPEFGRVCECRVFGEQLDFWNTQTAGGWTAAHSAYFISFIAAIDANQQLPPFDSKTTRCSIRSTRCTIGSDMDSEELEIC